MTTKEGHYYGSFALFQTVSIPRKLVAFVKCENGFWLVSLSPTVGVCVDFSWIPNLHINVAWFSSWEQLTACILPLHGLSAASHHC